MTLQYDVWTDENHSAVLAELLKALDMPLTEAIWHAQETGWEDLAEGKPLLTVADIFHALGYFNGLSRAFDMTMSDTILYVAATAED